MRPAKFFIVCGIAVAGIYAYSSLRDAHEADLKRISDHPCTSDWHKCSDMNDLMKYGDASKYEAYCEVKSYDIGANGAPDWSQKPFMVPKFGKYYNTTSFHETGNIILFDDTSLLPNQYGGKARVRLECMFNLNTQQATMVRAYPLNVGD